MNDQILADAFKAEADFIATGNNQFAPINRFVGITKETRTPPSLTFVVTTERVYGGRAGLFLVQLIVESTAADGDAAHRDRVNLVAALFVTDRASRIAAINDRGAVRISDYGQIPGKAEATHHEDGAKLRTPLVLRCAARIPDQV